MSEMIFENAINPVTHCEHPDIWCSAEGYHIMRFRYREAKPCEPYFRAYSPVHHHQLGGDYSMFEGAAGMCMAHREEVCR